jgi:hypothetical protein
MKHRYSLVLLIVLASMLPACAQIDRSPTPGVLPVPTALVFTPMDQLVRPGNTTTLGYLIIQNQEAFVTTIVGFADAEPVDLGGAKQQIWLGDGSVLALDGALAASGDVHHGIVLVRGNLEHGGVYGPNGAYAWQIQDAQLRVVAPQETAIAPIREATANYEQRLVRVVGWLLLAGNSVVLVDKLGVGGIPDPGSVSLKLRDVPDHPLITNRLQATVNGAVRFGQVQIEGVIEQGALVPITIRPVGR